MYVCNVKQQEMSRDAEVTRPQEKRKAAEIARGVREVGDGGRLRSENGVTKQERTRKATREEEEQPITARRRVRFCWFLVNGRGRNDKRTLRASKRDGRAACMPARKQQRTSLVRGRDGPGDGKLSRNSDGAGEGRHTGAVLRAGFQRESCRKAGSFNECYEYLSPRAKSSIHIVRIG